ncbi:MAG: rhomboid family intramembrane serine protease, partial [Candidatus Micrarchaeota archaeon]
LVSGVSAGLLFALINPGTLLAGASAGIAGLMTASVLLKPKHALVALIFVPLSISLVFFPLATYSTTQHEQSLQQKQTQLAHEVETLIQQNKTVEAQQANATLTQVKQQVSLTREGQAREQATPTDFWVHLYGAVFGAAYVFAFSRKHVKKGVKDFEKIGEFFFKLPGKIKRKL